MKKKIIFLFCFTLILFVSLMNHVYADYDAKVINASPCKLYSAQNKGKTATGSCMYADTKFNSLTPVTFWVDSGDNIKVITSKGSVKPPTSGYGSECKSSFSYISIQYKGTHYGYVCNDNIWDGKVPNDYAAEFRKAGFPESYYESLTVMKKSHPTWKFVAMNTELNFDDAVNSENYSGKSLIQVTSTVNDYGYLSVDEADFKWQTDKFIPKDSTTWYSANRPTIAYYMDPRNFLSDMYIFQYEPLTYTENSTNLKVVQTMLNGHYISRYADKYVKAGKEANVSAVYLASLSKQEIGGPNANLTITGNSFNYNGKTYKGFYNFYNIGATSGSNPALNGLYYAAGKPNSSGNATETSYNRPWNSIDKAINGGAKFIYESYVEPGQITSYLKKWSVGYYYALKQGIKKPTALYTHQYMTNIQAPSQEALSTYKSYNSLDLLDSAFTFYIPVYNNMPASTSLPSKGNPNNYLKNLTISKNSGSALNFSGFTGDKISYEMHVDSTISKVTLNATPVNSNAKVTGTGAKTLVNGSNIWTIKVTAQNGSVKTYTINIVKDSGVTTNKSVSEIVDSSGLNIDGNYLTGLTFSTDVSSIVNKVNKVAPNASVVVKSDNKQVTKGNVSTGDVVTINSNNESRSYTVVLYGDINGDGKVNALDLLKVQKNILKASKLNGASLKAADPSKDGKVNALDLLKVQKHILGVSFIDQG